MSSEDVAVLTAAYDALNGGDTEAALAVLTQDAEWVEHSDLPEAGSYKGRDSIRRFLAGFLESWEDFHQETERCVDGGDRVAIILRSRARGKGSGIEVESRYGHVWTMRDGKGVRVDTYHDPAGALEALERDEPQAGSAARAEP